MEKPDMKANWYQLTLKSAEGFTIVEVMLVLAITGLMLAGLIGGTFSAIGHQRYNDAYRDLAEYFSRIYSEVLAPETFGSGNSSGDNGQAILGKILVFGRQYDDSPDDSRSIYSATLVGSANISRATGATFLAELTDDNTRIAIVCGNNSGQESSVERYLPLWQSELKTTVTDGGPASERFRGMMIIARTPTSGTVHTVFTSSDDYILDLRDHCTPDDNSASTAFNQLMTDNDGSLARAAFSNSLGHSTGICVKSDDSAVVREVEITADGSNTSAVKTLSEEGSSCE